MRIHLLFLILFVCNIFSESLLLKEYSFEKADLNSDNQISPEEAKILAGGNEAYKMAFSLIDKDGSFSIDEGEFEFFIYQLEEYKKSKNIEDIQRHLQNAK